MEKSKKLLIESVIGHLKEKKDDFKMTPEEAKRLEKAGANFIVMPCNSLHVFIKEIRGSVRIPVLSIIEETVKFMQFNKFEKVGIVSTSATIQNKLYEDAFDVAGIGYEVPNELQQAKMGKIIHKE